MLTLLPLLTWLILQRLQTTLHGLCSLKRLAQLVQRILLLFLFRVVGGRGGLADLLLNVVETFLDRAFILSGITEIAILRSGVFENLVALLDPILELLSFDCVGCSTRFIRGFSVFLAVAEGLQLIGHRLQF